MARRLSTPRTMTDPAAKGFDPAGIPSGVGEALSKYLDRLPDQRRERDRGLLTALAYARGAGLDDPAWLAFAAALGYSASIADLDALRRSPAANYLLQTTTTERGAVDHPPVPPGPHRRAPASRGTSPATKTPARHALIKPSTPAGTATTRPRG
jgi:hypothetical protein